MAFLSSRTRVALLGLSSAIALWATVEGNAAIAPEYERVRQFEFAMRVANKAAVMLARHGYIEGLERMEDGTFRFRAGRCFVPVRLDRVIERMDPPIPGASIQYKVSLGEVRCE
jgi:hypothetical protein